MALFLSLFIAALLAAGGSLAVFAEPATVCTVTLNSSNEKDVFRRYLPEDRYRFVELVERGRADWLAFACRQQIRCDILVLSGHFDGVTDFYSDEIGAHEYLPVREMERASCSQSCPGLFSHLKEVYLFGCNTLNPEPTGSSVADLAQMLEHSGHSQAEAGLLARRLQARNGESSRDRMRRIFVDVPVIYGFSSTAPLGPTAASILGRYFQSTAGRDVGKGHASPELLAQFSAHRMAVTRGMRSSDPQGGYRREVCTFLDERPSPADKLEFIHRLLARDVVEARIFLDRIEQFFDGVSEGMQQEPAYRSALEAVTRDKPVRELFLAFAHTTEPSVRTRMIDLAAEFRWLTPAQQRDERMLMIGDIAAGQIDAADADLICAINIDHALDQELPSPRTASSPSGDVTRAVARACLGSAEARAQVLRALTSTSDADVRVAQIYVKHQPITDPAEVRALVSAVARMSEAEAQVHALDTLARLELSDRESLAELADLFPHARTLNVQRALAGILIRADYGAIDKLELIRVLRDNRLKSPDGDDVIDALIRRLADMT